MKNNPFKNLKLDAYEAEIESGLPELKLVKDKKTSDKYAGYAKETLAKKRNINIRLPEITLVKIKAKAAKLGLPYQTYISSVLHQISFN